MATAARRRHSKLEGSKASGVAGTADEEGRETGTEESSEKAYEVDKYGVLFMSVAD